MKLMKPAEFETNLHAPTSGTVEQLWNGWPSSRICDLGALNGNDSCLVDTVLIKSIEGPETETSADRQHLRIQGATRSSWHYY